MKDNNDTKEGSIIGNNNNTRKQTIGIIVVLKGMKKMLETKLIGANAKKIKMYICIYIYHIFIITKKNDGDNHDRKSMSQTKSLHKMRKSWAKNGKQCVMTNRLSWEKPHFSTTVLPGFWIPIGCYVGLLWDDQSVVMGKTSLHPSFYFSPGFNPLLKTLLNLVQGLVGIAQASAAKLHMVRNHVEI